jgi:putative N6-adenine-specific DNA methylase
MELFAVAPPGTESLLERELAALGIHGRAVPGGVELRGDAATVRRVNFESRLASRLLLRLGRFETLHLNELENLSAKLDVAPFLRGDEPLAVRATCRKSRIYHSGAASAPTLRRRKPTSTRTTRRRKPCWCVSTTMSAR